MELFVNKARIESGLSFRELADKACVARSYLEKLEDLNVKSNPSACVLCRLAHAMNVPVGSLFGCDDPD